MLQAWRRLPRMSGLPRLPGLHGLRRVGGLVEAAAACAPRGGAEERRSVHTRHQAYSLQLWHQQRM